ncbi:MAG TPA: hypothetical protein VNX86_04845 [Rhizomicrobium sp.]|jgi:hypothetical protein|nr:hypothetical protein [Rhizomicrobium sp.]
MRRLGGCPIVWLTVAMQLTQGILLAFFPKASKAPAELVQSAPYVHLSFQTIHLTPVHIGLLLIVSSILASVGVWLRARNVRVAIALLMPAQYIAAMTFLSRANAVWCACTPERKLPDWSFVMVGAAPGMMLSVAFTMALWRLARGHDYGWS